MPNIPRSGKFAFFGSLLPGEKRYWYDYRGVFNARFPPIKIATVKIKVKSVVEAIQVTTEDAYVIEQAPRAIALENIHLGLFLAKCL